MNITGIIAEYNPFHLGHLEQISQLKSVHKTDFVVAVMSGNFVQRGEPAVFDKYLRTRAALLSGVGLVIELPSVFASSSAESFANAGLQILNATGMVDSISFGHEAAEFSLLRKIASCLCPESEGYKTLLKTFLNQGLSFPKAREQALEGLLGLELSDVFKANNILAIEYLKAMKKTESKLHVLPIRRQGSGFDSLDMDIPFASATAIRHELFKSNPDFEKIEKTIPNKVAQLYKNELLQKRIARFDRLSSIANYILSVTGKDGLHEVSGMVEGLENSVKNASAESFFISDYIKNIKSKRYTYSALSRLFLRMILAIKKDEAAQNPLYLRVLGFRKDSEILLSLLSKNAKLPVVTNLKDAGQLLDPAAFSSLKNEIMRTDIYNLSLDSAAPFKKSYEMSQPLVIV